MFHGFENCLLLLTHDELLLRLAHIHKLDFAMQFVNGCLYGVSWYFQGMSSFVSFRLSVADP
jgi:hypothetical protein